MTKTIIGFFAASNDSRDLHAYAGWLRAQGSDPDTASGHIGKTKFRLYLQPAAGLIRAQQCKHMPFDDYIGAIRGALNKKEASA